MEDKIILIDKPAGISSFGVVAKVRTKLRDEFKHKVKVGHTGTLDPFATGLLILLSGQMTKKSSNFLKQDKIYEATLKLGCTSTTGDPEGEISAYATKESENADCGPSSSRNTIPNLSTIESVIHNFIGKINQTPPRFSAIKINGQRAYKLARKGQDFEIPQRQVEIYSIDILDFHYPELKIKVHCSSGTYIRTLAEDIGKKLHTGAYLTALRRIKIGDYNIKDAIPLSDFVLQ
ncbi:tRNA pseudouridine(55) synthase TruB [Candidatus Saccharibacteria bacterium]|nr:tRNA pseudouridine(55) synthase TruB [Candidatus Saccharibacteria bacterium]